MFPAHCSIYVNHCTGLLSDSIPPFIHPCIQSSPTRRSASPDGWSKPITTALPCFSIFTVPPSSFLVLSFSFLFFLGGLSSVLLNTKMFAILLIVWPWQKSFYISSSIFVPATALTHFSQCFATISFHFPWFSLPLVQQDGIMHHLTSGFRNKFLSQHLQCYLDRWNPLFQLYPLPTENGGKCPQLGATTST